MMVDPLAIKNPHEVTDEAGNTLIRAQVPLERIQPYHNNPRRNSHAVPAVKKSIEQFGQLQPLVVDEHYIILAGHTRYMALIELNYTYVDTLIVSHLSEDEARAYRIADNKTAEAAEWDFELLQSEMQALQDVDFDISTLGFSDRELAEVFKTMEQPDRTTVSTEVDTTSEQFQFEHRCPKCGFEFNDK